MGDGTTWSIKSTKLIKVKQDIEVHIGTSLDLSNPKILFACFPLSDIIGQNNLMGFDL